MLYADTSALLKLYVTDKGSPETSQEIAAASAIGTSAITRVEIEATLARAVKAGRLPAADLPLLLSRLNREWSPGRRT